MEKKHPDLVHYEYAVHGLFFPTNFDFNMKHHQQKQQQQRKSTPSANASIHSVIQSFIHALSNTCHTE